MIHPTIVRFYDLVNSFETTFILEMQNCVAHLELVEYQDFHEGFKNTFPNNNFVQYFGMDDTAFILFKPSFETTTTFIATDSSGKIYKLDFKQGPKYIKKEIASTIFDFLKTSTLSIQRLTSIYKFFEYNQISKFPIDEKLGFVDFQHRVQKCLSQNPQVTSTVVSIERNEENSEKKIMVSFHLEQSPIQFSINNQEFQEGGSAFTFVEVLNTKLQSFNSDYSFIIVHENQWDSLHAILFVDNELFEKLKDVDLIVQ